MNHSNVIYGMICLLMTLQFSQRIQIKEHFRKKVRYIIKSSALSQYNKNFTMPPCQSLPRCRNMYISLSVSPSLYLITYLSLSLSLSIYLSISISLYLIIYLSLSISLSHTQINREIPKL